MSVTDLSPEATEALGGPPWLVARRRDAWAKFAERELPSEADEEWHYSQISRLDPAVFAPPPDPAPAAASPPSLPETAARLLEALGPVAALCVSVDGAVRETCCTGRAGGGLRLRRLAEATSPPASLGDIGDAPDALSLLSEAFVRDGVVVTVPDRSAVALPVAIVHVVTSASAGRLVAPRTLVELGAGAEARVVEVLVSGDEVALVAPASELRLGEGAQLAYLSAQQLGASAIQLGSQHSRLERDAVLTSFVAALGGGLARQRTQSVLAGENAESRLFAVYLADGRQVLSFRTVQEHLAPRTRSELVFKGAVAGQARSGYTGLVRMHRGARKADASQTNRNLVLSPSAEAASVPNLDIEENDVRCSHASAVGPIDAEQRFYLESRGVPPAAAERLVLAGFFEEILARSPEAGFATHVRAALPARLEAATATAGAGGRGSRAAEEGR